MEEDKMAVRVADQIATLLFQRKMTQKELAKVTDITESAISHYIKGDRVPRGVNLIKIAKALGVTTDYLLDTGEGDEDDNQFRTVKTLIARNAEKMSMEERMELMRMLAERK
jgi:transcriptional regulator with XRE-family HTH domain